MKTNDYGLQELREVDMLNKFQHPNIISLIDSGILNSGEGLFMILPLAKGSIDMFRPNVELTKLWIYQLVSAVFFLHKNGFYHCDIKPENVLLIEDDRIVLADFGLANRVNIPRPSNCQTFASPQLSYRENPSLRYGIKEYDELCSRESNGIQEDKWALGWTIGEILTGKPIIEYGKHRQPPPVEFLQDRKAFISDYLQNVSEELREPGINMLMKLMNPDPTERSFNLLELLSNPIMLGKSNYVDGTLTVTPNDNPFIFDETKANTLQAVKDLFNKELLGKKDHIGKKDQSTWNEIYDILDLFMRTLKCFSQSFNIKKVDLLYLSCFFEVGKVDETANFYFRFSFKDYFYGPKGYDFLMKNERLIFNCVKGRITRNNVFYFLEKEHYLKGLEWIIQNLERYDQVSPEVMAQIIRSLP
uniref:Protein kinase domain-containing protein n=1 Tax=viral metagenome TaxID=1070528 RepID=A0A6C0KSZ0_9ZZZZ